MPKRLLSTALLAGALWAAPGAAWAEGPGHPRITRLAPQALQGGSSGVIELAIALPPGVHLNADAPFSYTITATGMALALPPGRTRYEGPPPALPIRVPFRTDRGEGLVRVELNFYHCREDGRGPCVGQRVCWEVPVVARAVGVRRIRLEAIAAPLPPD
jgi:hypothetical protein